MNFSDYYFTEAKLSALRQFLNIFSKEKKINIDLAKDLIFIGETDENTFSNINNELATSYKQYKQYIKSKKLVKHREDKTLARWAEKRRLTLETGNQIINVFNVNIKGGEDKLAPYNTITAAAAYETGRALIHYGYIVTVIVEDIDGSSKYFIGGDRLGLKFFKELFGTNMDIYLATKSVDRKKPKVDGGEEPEKEVKLSQKEYGYIRVGGTKEFKNELFADIKNTWGDNKGIKPNYKSKISNIKGPESLRINKVTLNGYEYTLSPSNTSIYVGIGRATDKDPTLLILFNDGKETMEEARNLKLFNGLKTLAKPDDIFKSVSYTKTIEKI